MLAKYLQHIRKQRNAGPEKDQPGHIKSVRLFAIVRQVQVDQNQTGQSNRNIQEEDNSPVKISDDQPARDWPEHRANQRGNGNEAHRADQFGLCERPHQSEPADGYHHGSAAAL